MGARRHVSSCDDAACLVCITPSRTPRTCGRPAWGPGIHAAQTCAALDHGRLLQLSRRYHKYAGTFPLCSDVQQPCACVKMDGTGIEHHRSCTCIKAPSYAPLKCGAGDCALGPSRKVGISLAPQPCGTPCDSTMSSSTRSFYRTAGKREDGDSNELG